MEYGKGLVNDVYVLRIDRDEYLLESLEKFVKEEDLLNGLIMTGYGTLSESVMHMVTTLGFPAHEHFDTRKDQALELVSLDGIIANGHIHAHMTISDTKYAYAGHLEKNCKVLYLCEVVIGKIENINMKRQIQQDTKLNLLSFKS